MGASFQLALAFDKMESCRHKRHDEIVSPQGEVGRGNLNCGSKFSHVGASFQLAHAFDKMKSCRHKRDRNLILDWFRTGGGDLIGPRRGIQRQGETTTPSTLELTVSNAESVRGWPGPKLSLIHI